MLISSIGCVATIITMTSRENAISHLLAISKVKSVIWPQVIWSQDKIPQDHLTSTYYLTLTI